MDQGAGGLSAEALQEELNFYGTEIDTEVGFHTATVSLSGLSYHKQELLNLFLKVVKEPGFSDEEWKTLQKQLIQSRTRQLEEPGYVISERLKKALFDGPAAAPRGGDNVSLRKLDLKSIRTFYKDQYGLNEAVFLVVGNFDKKFAKKNHKLFWFARGKSKKSSFGFSKE